MRAKRTFLLVAVLLLLGISAWFIPSSRPSILFTGFRDTSNGQVAVFLVTNPSASTFTYFTRCISTEPFYYVYRIQSGGDWQTVGPITSGCSEASILPAHYSFEFIAKPPLDDYSGPFAVGVEFFRGNPDEVSRRNTSRFARCLWWLRSVTGFRKSDYTWSKIAKR